MTTVAFLQARMSSSRLRGKVLADVLGEPMIYRQLERIYRSNVIDEVVVLTSKDASDDPLAEFLSSKGQPVLRGDLENVFSRFQIGLELYPCETALRLTADCPLIDPQIIDQTVRLHLSEDADYTSNSLIRTFPRGLDCEVFKPSVIQGLSQSDLSNDEIEHVTLAIYARPSNLRLRNLENLMDESRRRWTVDFPKDLQFVRFVYETLFPQNASFTSNEIRELLGLYPEMENYEEN